LFLVHYAVRCFLRSSIFHFAKLHYIYSFVGNPRRRLTASPLFFSGR
jgi:hypothetical protein